MFLERVAISQFRPYGDFALELPGPGVTILVGPNGLGKSAFFEAIEWALTGRVQRLDELPKDRDRGRSYLPRMHADGTTRTPCQVHLQFTGDRSLSRRLHSDQFGDVHDEVSILPGMSAVDLLQDPNWPLPIAPESLGSYLRSTHFLGQAASLRLTGQDPRQRWQRLSQLNGAAFVSRIQSQLMTRATTTAIKEATRKAEATVALLEVQREQWIGLIDQRNGLRDSSVVEGALAPNLVFDRAMALPQRLARFAPPTGANEADTKGALSRARLALDTADRELAASKARLDALRQLPQEWAEQRARSAALTDDLQRLGVAIALVQSNSVAAQEALGAAKARLATVAEAQKKAESVVTLTREVARVAEAFEVAKRREQALSQEVEETKAVAKALEARQVLAAERATLLDRRATMASRQRELEAVATEARAIVVGLEDEQSQHEHTVKREGELKQTLAQLTEAESRHRELQRSVAAAASRLEVLRREDSALTAALATIATLIESAGAHCPVCQSEFTPAELERRARAAAQRASPTLIDAEDAKRTLEQTESDIFVELQRIRDRAQQLQAAASQDNEKRVALRSRQTALLTSPSLRGLAFAEVAAFVAAELLSLQGELGSVQSRLDELESAATASGADAQALSEVRARLLTLTAQLDAILREQRERRATLERNQDVLATVQHLSPDELAATLGQTLVTANENVQVEVDSVGHAEELSRNASVELRDAQERLDPLTASLASLSRSSQLLEAQWRDSQLEGLPTEAGLMTALRAVVDDQVEAAGWREVIARLTQSLAAWEASDALKKVERELSRVLERERCATEQELSQLLRTRLEESRSHVQKAERVGSAVTRMRGLFKAVSESYYQEVLAPLNVLERRFVRALTVRTPFDVSLSQRTSRGATQLDLTSRFDGQSNSPMLSAAHLLSEGQLAATAFTQVVSMSTAYRWSAWPALLLDDPVQHNDVLHVSAFVDLLRNLVREQAYQVVLSTHDPEIANFISRKLRSDGGIDQLTCHFEGLGEAGVTYRAV